LHFIRRNRVLLTSAFCLLIAAGLVLQTGRMPGRSDRLGRFFLEVMAPFQRGMGVITHATRSGWRGFGELVRARGENAALHARAQQLEQALDRMNEIELENTRLRKLLDFRETLTGDVLTARVIGRDATGVSRTLVLDRGEADGVTKGAAALAPEGIVGHVFFASAHAARVLLISDHNSGVDALVQRTRARGIVQGTVDASCSLKYVKRTEDVQVGDTLVTSGLDGIFPKGQAIGQVTAIDKRGKGLFQSADVAPRVDFDSLEEVLVTRGALTQAEAPAADQ